MFDPTGVERVVFLSGKMYYDLIKERSDRNLDGKIAFVRLEVRDYDAFRRAMWNCDMVGTDSVIALIISKFKSGNFTVSIFRAGISSFSLHQSTLDHMGSGGSSEW